MAVNRYCSSRLQATRMVLPAIRAREGDALVSAGVEPLSWEVFSMSDGKPGIKYIAVGSAQRRTSDRADSDGAEPRRTSHLPDLNIAMGETGENLEQLHGITAAEQEAHAARSPNLVKAFIGRGLWAKGIAPETLPEGSPVTVDDGPCGAALDSDASLELALRENDTVTAAGCSFLDDGAMDVLTLPDVSARELGLTPLARRVSMECPVRPPRELGIKEDQLNTNTTGAAFAVGQPFGMTFLSATNDPAPTDFVAMAERLERPIQPGLRTTTSTDDLTTPADTGTTTDLERTGSKARPTATPTIRRSVLSDPVRSAPAHRWIEA